MTDHSTSLSVERTMLAHDRTLMAWVRTSTSMISFGLTFYKFFQYLEESQPARDVHRLLGPRGVALILIGIGLAALAMAAYDYRHQTALLRRRYEASYPQHSIALAVATMVAGLGVFGLVLVLFRQ